MNESLMYEITLNDVRTQFAYFNDSDREYRAPNREILWISISVFLYTFQERKCEYYSDVHSDEVKYCWVKELNSVICWLRIGRWFCFKERLSFVKTRSGWAAVLATLTTWSCRKPERRFGYTLSSKVISLAKIAAMSSLWARLLPLGWHFQQIEFLGFSQNLRHFRAPLRAS